MRGWVDKLKRVMGDKRGLTLMELVVVLSILAILAAIVTPAVTGATTFGRATAATGDVKNVQEAVDRYQGDNPTSKWPTSDGEVPTTAFSDSLVTSAMLTAISWDAPFTDPRTGTTKTFVPNYLRQKPAHDDETRYFAQSDTIKTFYDGAEVVLTIYGAGTYSVWNLNKDGKVVLLLSADQY